MKTGPLVLVLALAASGCDDAARRAGVQGDPERGRIAITQYACHGCHQIPGITGGEVYVGRPLGNLAGRAFIAGELPSNQENLVRWILAPQVFDPASAMPDMGVTERDAIDISAYLLTLE